MTEEKKAEHFADKDCCKTCHNINHSCKEKCECWEFAKKGFLAGLHEGQPKWHKVTDWKNTEQFPQEVSFPYFVVTKKEGYYLCEWEIDEGCGQFYSMYEGVDIDPEDVVMWQKIEIPQFKE